MQIAPKVDLMTSLRWMTGEPRTTIRHKNAGNRILHERASWSIRATLEDAAAGGVRLGGAYLPQTKLKKAKLEGIYLASSNLDGAQMQQAECGKALMGRVSAVGARWQGIKLAGADLTDSTLTDIHADYADLHQADFSRATINGQARMRNASAVEAVFSGADLAGLDAEGAHFSRALMIGTNLSGGRFPKARFQGADLSNAFARDADLRGADFRDAVVDGFDVQGADLRGAIFPISLDIAKLKLNDRTRLDGVILVDRHGNKIDNAQLTAAGIRRLDGNAPDSPRQAGGNVRRGGN